VKLAHVLFIGLVEPIGFVLSLYQGDGLDNRDSRTGLTIIGGWKELLMIEVSLYALILHQFLE